MTDAELSAIEEQAREWLPVLPADTLALCAEVRRLRELLRCALPYVPDHHRPETPLAILHAEIVAAVAGR